MINITKLKFKDVKTKAFGKKLVTIRVNEESIKHYARKVILNKIIEEMKLSIEDETPYHIAAGLMSICTDPKTGKFSFEVDQLSDFVDNVSGDLFSELTLENSKLNPSWFLNDKDNDNKTLTTKKKNT